MQTLNNNSYSQTSGVLDDCLARRGYEYQTPSDSLSDKEKVTTAEVAKTVGKVLLGTAIVAVAVAALAACAVLSVLAGGI
jgi:hypothetical protein